MRERKKVERLGKEGKEIKDAWITDDRKEKQKSRNIIMTFLRLLLGRGKHDRSENEKQKMIVKK